MLQTYEVPPIDLNQVIRPAREKEFEEILHLTRIGVARPYSYSWTHLGNLHHIGIGT